MGVVAGASTRSASRGPRGARCSARRTVAGKDARTRTAGKGRKGARPSARGMVGERGVRSRVGFVQRACTVGPFTAWPTGVGRGVPSQSVRRARGGGPTIACVTAGARGVNMTGAGRARRVVRITARHTVGGGDACGATRDPSSGGVKRGFARRMVVWFRIRGYTVVRFRILKGMRRIRLGV
ncbi:probable WRKY transcription factor 19 [Phtheirospermum japonicum]|uniref:Probable WRKY transcription factor 19 n=1 Tax=Phtheirospermum japonicum TaxID=374723 RepID=A0A830BNX1_9LAMI|nr:probable WRKY transcription factor 19 [Phtheirospermum japonicum]